jgi:hypothetical protein
MATTKKTEQAFDDLAEELAGKGVTTGKMFGMPILKTGTKSFAGLYKESMTFKLTGAAHKRALALKGAKLFDPMGGRPMKEWVQVPAAHAKTEWKKLAQSALKYVADGT